MSGLINFSRNLQRLKEERCVTFREIEIETGISDSTLVRYANGAEPTLENAIKITRFFGLDLDDMVRGDYYGS